MKTALFDKGFVYLVTGYKMPPFVFEHEADALAFISEHAGYDAPIKQPIL